MFNNKYPYLDDKRFLVEMDKLRNRSQMAKIILLDWDETPMGDIVGKISNGNVNLDGGSAVRRTCNLTVFIKETELNIMNIKEALSLNKKINVEIGLRNDLKKEFPQYAKYDFIWYPIGLYVIVNASISSGTGGTNVSLQLKDKMCLLNGDCGGTLPAAISFNEIESIGDNGNKIILQPTISQIIRELVNHWGGEQIPKIIISDIDEKIKMVMQWNGTVPLYLISSKNDLNDKHFTTNQDEIALIDKKIFDYKVFEPGANIGYIYTDFTYTNGDLTCNAGDSITSVLDKIKDFLGNYEYFYDLNGNFVFQEIKNYLNTSQSTGIIKELQNENSGHNIAEDYFIDQHNGKSVYEFNNSNLINSYNNNPQYNMIKNDFVVWGQRKDLVNNKTYPIRYHLAIDEKPEIEDNESMTVFKYLDPNDNLIKAKDFIDLTSLSSEELLDFLKSDGLEGRFYRTKKLDNEIRTDIEKDELERYKDYFATLARYMNSSWREYDPEEQQETDTDKHDYLPESARYSKDKTDNIINTNKNIDSYFSIIDKYQNILNDTLKEDAQWVRKSIKSNIYDFYLNQLKTTKITVKLHNKNGYFLTDSQIGNIEDTTEWRKEFVDIPSPFQYDHWYKNKVIGSEKSVERALEVAQNYMNQWNESIENIKKYANIYNEVISLLNEFGNNLNNIFIDRNNANRILIAHRTFVDENTKEKLLILSDKEDNIKLESFKIQGEEKTGWTGRTYVLNKNENVKTAFKEAFPKDWERYEALIKSANNSVLRNNNIINYLSTIFNNDNKTFILNLIKKFPRIFFENKKREVKIGKNNQKYSNMILRFILPKDQEKDGINGVQKYTIFGSIEALNLEMTKPQNTSAMLQEFTSLLNEMRALLKIAQSTPTWLSKRLAEEYVISEMVGITDGDGEQVYQKSTTMGVYKQLMNKWTLNSLSIKNKDGTPMLAKPTQYTYSQSEFDTLSTYNKMNAIITDQSISSSENNELFYYEDCKLIDVQEFVKLYKDDKYYNQLQEDYIALSNAKSEYEKEKQEIITRFKEELSIYNNVYEQVLKTNSLFDLYILLNTIVNNGHLELQGDYGRLQHMLTGKDNYVKYSKENDSSVINNIEKICEDYYNNDAIIKELYKDNKKYPFDIFHSLSEYEAGIKYSLLDNSNEKYLNILNYNTANKDYNYQTSNLGNNLCHFKDFINKIITEIRLSLIRIYNIKKNLNYKPNVIRQWSTADKKYIPISEDILKVIPEKDQIYFELEPDKNIVTVPILDWRTKLYIQGVDSEPYGEDSNYYYTELLNEWPKLYAIYGEEYEVEKENSSTKEIEKIKEVKTPDFWSYVKDNPSGIDYFLDIIDDLSNAGEISVRAIGRRTKVINDNNINCIFEPEIPDYIIIELGKEDTEEKQLEARDSGYDYIQVDSSIFSCLIGGKGYNSAYDQVRALMYQYTSYNETISIQSMPIYHLEPNTRISVFYPQGNIYGDYVLKTISIPLDLASLSTMTATRALERF